jgi:hypothetical protein
MTIRIFGSNECQVCQTLTGNLRLMQVSFDFVDALNEKSQALCDEFNVDDLPHIQVLDDKGRVVWEDIGDVPLTKILRKAKNELRENS